MRSGRASSRRSEEDLSAVEVFALVVPINHERSELFLVGVAVVCTEE